MINNIHIMKITVKDITVTPGLSVQTRMVLSNVHVMSPLTEMPTWIIKMGLTVSTLTSVQVKNLTKNDLILIIAGDDIADHDCDVNANCNNVDGGWECTCKHGWTGNGTHCMDFEECEKMRNEGIFHTGGFPFLRSFQRTAYTYTWAINNFRLLNFNYRDKNSIFLTLELILNLLDIKVSEKWKYEVYFDFKYFIKFFWPQKHKTIDNKLTLNYKCDPRWPFQIWLPMPSFSKYNLKWPYIENFCQNSIWNSTSNDTKLLIQIWLSKFYYIIFHF